LRAELVDWLERHRAGAAPAILGLAADMRYAGQSYEIEGAGETAWLGPWRGPGGARPLLSASHQAHARAFGHADREAPAEIVNLRVQLRAARPRVPLGGVAGGEEALAPPPARRAP